MITIENKKHGAIGVYVGRSSPVSVSAASQGGASVIRDYEDSLAEPLLDPISLASGEIHRLAE
jgi:hypothetical protein